MEKRLVFAFLASFIFLTAWNALVSKGSRQSGVSEDGSVLTPVADIKKDVPAPAEDFPKDEETFVLENDNLKFDISSFGADINTIYLKRYGISFPLKDLFKVNGLPRTLAKGRVSSEKQIEFVSFEGNFEVKKSYSLDERFLLTAEVMVRNVSDKKVTSDIRTNNFTLDINSLDNNEAAGRDKSLLEYSFSAGNRIFRKGNAVQFTDKENKAGVSNLDWFGFRDRYFCVVSKPDVVPTQASVLAADSKVMMFESEFRGFQFLPGESKTVAFQLYVGPQNQKILKSYNSGFEHIFAFSRFGLLNFISNAINSAISFIQNIVKSYGISVVIISFLIYGLLYPLTLKSAVSMRKMQVLQPKINELREKYKNDPQRMNKEVLELYKEKQVNPFSGCLPLFLQMPIFIGLYQVLWRSISLKGESFLWMKDLAEPDRLVIFPFSLPVLGNELNILPIIIAVLMYFQQKITSKNIVVSDPNQVMQQRMMGVFMPIFLGFIFYKFSSGLCIYFTVFYALSTLTQWKMSKMKVL